MCENLLSPLHIQKLGHPIEEIRLRALTSVISKYNLNLVDECNLTNTKLLIEKLLNWFYFDQYSEEEKVLKLLLKILKCKNADLIVKEINKKNLFKQVEEVKKKISSEYHSLIQDITKQISNAVEEKDAENDDYHCLPYAERAKLVNGSVPTGYYEIQKDFFISNTRSEVTNNARKLDKVPVEDVNKSCLLKSVFKVEYFPWQHLILEDKEILTSVYDGLRYIDNKNLILRSCQFFNEVLLKDFPVEIFLQQPIIIKTFLQLIECLEQDVRIPVLKCLIKTVHQLRKRVQVALNVSLFNLKKEFYSTNVFTNLMDESENSVENLNIISFNEAFQCDDNDYVDPALQKYQLSVPQFCFETLLKILPHLSKEYDVEEINCFLNLSYETLTCIIFNLNPGIWHMKELRNKFQQIFKQLCDALKFQKKKNQIFYVILLYLTIKLLKSVKPPSEVELREVLTEALQFELSSCISNFVLVLLFPLLHTEILKVVERLPGHKEKESVQDYKDVIFILESMKSSVKFLKCFGKLKSRLEKLECLQSALLSLDFHQDACLIKSFVTSCLLKWKKAQLNDAELELREKILIRLLSHCNDFVKISIYTNIHAYAVKFLGVEEAKTARFEFPGDKMEFLFHTDILTEIICHGLNSSITEVRKCSSETMNILLTSKFIMSEICWSEFLSALIPCLSLLQCFADKATILGRCIIKMFDPDVAKSMGLPTLEVLKGNMRFLFSKNSLIRDEALSRLFWLLNKHDSENKKLPRMSVLTGLNLSGICCCVKPQEYIKTRLSYYSPDRLCDVLEMLNAGNIEPNLRRSALSQISVMMDDANLHSTLLEQKGLEKLLEILDNCLTEKECLHYPDSVKPITDILKALAFQNVCVRQELSCRLDVMFNILRGLFLFSSDDILRQNAVELICLLLYTECIIRVPSEFAAKSKISFPDLVVNRMCLPFLTHIHWKNSRHLEPSNKKSLMSKDNCSKLIRVSWAIHWVGSLSELLAIQPADYCEKVFSPGIPNDLKVSNEEVECLRNCTFGLSVKRTLYNIQNATTHEAVFSSLHKLQSYFLLYNIAKATNTNTSHDQTNYISDIGSETFLSHMLWESTLERFMTAQPSSNQDESLLLQVIQLVQVLLKSFKSERLINWVGKLLHDEHQPFIKLLRNVEEDKIGTTGKELRLAIIELTQQIVTQKATLDRNQWFLYLELISSHLILEKKDKFYNVAYVDWFLSLLVDLTGNWSWNFAGKTDYLEKLIVRIMEIIIAFYCIKDASMSFMGIDIVKNSLLVLNHIIACAKESVKDWEKLCFQALTKVVGHNDGSNYCWMLSLWFTRDTITRAAAYALFVNFSATTLSCDLLIDQLNIKFEYVWSQTFKVLFDEKECSFVREQASFLLSNLTSQGTRTSCGNFLQHLEKIDFYQEIVKIISKYDSEPRLSEARLHDTFNSFSGNVVTTPSFLTSVCILLTRVMALNTTEVSLRLLEFNVLDCLINVLGEIPESAAICGKHQNSTDIIKMYTAICKLFTKSVKSNCSVHSFLLRSEHCVNYFFSMINFNLYCKESATIRHLRTELWSEIFDLFSVLLVDKSKSNAVFDNQSAGFIIINKCMTDNGIDHFTSSLYIAMTSEDLNLRSAAFKFLINLFRHELITPKHVTVSDAFDRKISTEALKQTIIYGWKALTISESLTLNFGIRAADILTQMFVLSTSCTVQSCKATIAECLGSLLAVCRSAQNFCVERGLPDSLILNLKQICVKLNLESVENLKKSSSKKKVDPLLSDSEILFRIICNLVLGNEKAKTAVADSSLSTVVHKLWSWCMAKRSLLAVALKMLCTFTQFCDQACRTLVLSGSQNFLGLKKSSGSQSLMNAVLNQVSLEMDLVCSSHNSQILLLCLQLLTNCCRVGECRSMFSKGNFLQCFVKLDSNQKKRGCGDEVVESWLKFFLAFSSYPDGQLILSKSQELLDLFIKKSTKSNHRISALKILRNICFHQLNRVRMLSFCSFLSLMFETLDSKAGEEVQTVALMIWALTCNSQKAKLIVRSSGFEAKLAATKRRCTITEDTDTANLLEIVLSVLKNK